MRETMTSPWHAGGKLEGVQGSGHGCSGGPQTLATSRDKETGKVKPTSAPQCGSGAPRAEGMEHRVGARGQH